MDAAQKQTPPAPQGADQARPDNLPTRGGVVVDEALRRRIAEAIQPVVTQLREQAAATVAQEAAHVLEEELKRGRRVQASRPSSGEAKPGAPEAQKPGTSQPDEPAGKGLEPRHDDKAADKAVEQGGSGDQEEGGGLKRELGRAFGQVLQSTLTQEVGEPLHELYHTALDGLFSRSFLAALEPQIEDTVWALLDSLIETVDSEGVRRTLRAEGEEILTQMLSRTFEAVFTDAVCRQLEDHGDRAIDYMLAGDPGSALREATRALHVVLPRILWALEGEWGLLLPFLVRIAFAALRDTIESAIKEGLGLSPSVNKDEVEERVESLHDKVEDATDDLRANLTNVGDQLRDRIQEEKGLLRERISEGVRSALHGGSKGPGGQPSGRPPFGRPLNGRPPSLGSPSGRPPSAPRLAPPSVRKHR